MIKEMLTQIQIELNGYRAAKFGKFENDSPYYPQSPRDVIWQLGFKSFFNKFNHISSECDICIKSEDQEKFRIAAK